MGFRRKYLSADGLIGVVRYYLRKEKLPACIGSEYSWQDCIMSGLAIFGFKYNHQRALSSVLEHQKTNNQPNGLYWLAGFRGKKS